MFHRSFKSINVLLALSLAVLVVVSAQAGPASSAAGEPPVSSDFVRAALQGFGDRQNSIAWSMAWWKGQLYVGTGRSAQCVYDAAVLAGLPRLEGALPQDPDVLCPDDSHDLVLQAEIWRWTPATNTWERVFQSPNDVPIPDPDRPGEYVPGKFVARDIGFRGMLPFIEADGTHALYVAGVSSRDMYGEGVPPPRILRSTDGVTFTPLPQEPGTLLGDTPARGFRSMMAHNGRLYVTASKELLGQGPVYEAADPRGGNNNFRQITPAGSNYYDLASFNGSLYIGAGDRRKPFSIVRTDTTGWPYTFTPIVTDGAYNPQRKSVSVVSMHVFKNRLYVGTDRPSELLRINPDDSWDLILGTPRNTPSGRKEPMGGMEGGFDTRLNIHIWRMQSHNGVLYVGTLDNSTAYRTLEQVGRFLEPAMGFDLYATSDGANFSMITRNGMGDKFNLGLRTFASTPYGLFVGANNYFYGLNIWRFTTDNDPLHKVYMPFAVGAGSGEGAPEPAPQLAPEPLRPPQDVQADGKGGKTVLSWTPQPGATKYRIYRADFLVDGDFPLLGEDPGARIPYPFHLIGHTSNSYYVDTPFAAGEVYQYYVRAENGDGVVTPPSAVMRMPSLTRAGTFAGLQSTVATWSAESPTTAQGIGVAVRPVLASAEALVRTGDLEGARRQLEQLQQTLVSNSALLDPWRGHDFGLLLDKLLRRMELVRLGVLAPTDLL